MDGWREGGREGMMERWREAIEGEKGRERKYMYRESIHLQYVKTCKKKSKDACYPQNVNLTN